MGRGLGSLLAINGVKLSLKSQTISISSISIVLLGFLVFTVIPSDFLAFSFLKNPYVGGSKKLFWFVGVVSSSEDFDRDLCGDLNLTSRMGLRYLFLVN